MKVGRCENGAWLGQRFRLGQQIAGRNDPGAARHAAFAMPKVEEALPPCGPFLARRIHAVGHLGKGRMQVAAAGRLGPQQRGDHPEGLRTRAIMPAETGDRDGRRPGVRSLVGPNGREHLLQLLLAQALLDLAQAVPPDRFLPESEAVQAKHNQHRILRPRRTNSDVQIRMGVTLTFAGNELTAPARRRVTMDVWLGRGEGLDFETRRRDPLGRVCAIVANMVPLAEMKLAAGTRGDGRVLVGLLERQRERERQDRKAAGTENAPDLRQRSPVVDMLEHMVGNDDVPGLVGQVDGFDVQDAVGIAGNVGGEVGCGEPAVDPAHHRLGCKVQDALAAQTALVRLDPEILMPVPLERPAGRAFRIEPRRQPRGPELTTVAADVALSRMDPAQLPDDLAGIVHTAAHRLEPRYHPRHPISSRQVGQPRDERVWSAQSCKDRTVIGKGQSWDGEVTGKDRNCDAVAPSLKDAADDGRVPGQPLLVSALGAPPNDRRKSETASGRDDCSYQDVRQSRPHAGVPPTPSQRPDGPGHPPYYAFHHYESPTTAVMRLFPALSPSSVALDLLGGFVSGHGFATMYGPENRGPRWTAPCQNWLPGPDSNQRPTG